MQEERSFVLPKEGRKMLQAIKHRLERCETWKQPHEDISWLVAEIERLQAERQTMLAACEAGLDHVTRGHVGCEQWLADDKVHDIFTAAIAKAEGRE